MRAEGPGASPDARDLDQVGGGPTAVVCGLCADGPAAEGADTSAQPISGAGAFRSGESAGASEISQPFRGAREVCSETTARDALQRAGGRESIEVVAPGSAINRGAVRILTGLMVFEETLALHVADADQ